MEAIIEKYFKGERTIYFHQSDKHKQIAGDTYLRFEYRGSYSGIDTHIWYGSNEGECLLKICSDAESLESLIQLMIN